MQAKLKTYPSPQPHDRLWDHTEKVGRRIHEIHGWQISISITELHRNSSTPFRMKELPSFEVKQSLVLQRMNAVAEWSAARSNGRGLYACRVDQWGETGPRFTGQWQERPVTCGYSSQWLGPGPNYAIVVRTNTHTQLLLLVRCRASKCRRNHC